MIQVVGITGFKRSGKGTVANFLSEDPDVGVVYQIGFSDKLKQLAALSLGFKGNPRDLIAMMDEAKLDSGWLLNVTKLFAPRTESFTAGDMEFVIALPSERATFHSVTGREFLQHLGTEARRLLGEDIWVDQVLPQPQLGRQGLEYMYPEVDILAITDLRFENEARRVKELGGVIWEVTRPDTESDGHDSEQRLPEHLIDWTIPNTGTLDDLRDHVEIAIRWTL